MANPMSIPDMEAMARQLRRHIIRMISGANSGHPGGSLSSVEIITALYFRVLKHDPKDPLMPERDRFVLSKGHAAPVLYAALAECGYLDVAALSTLRQIDSCLQGHTDCRITPGVEMSAGALGQGLSFAVGVSLGTRLDKKDCRTYVLLGDGECDEGQVWEAAMAAAHFRLDNLIAFLDYNKLALDGSLEEIMEIADITAKWVSFNWFVQRIDGHDYRQLEHAIQRAKLERGRPSMIVLDTIKGKGCSFAENRVESHHMSFDMTKAREAIAILEAEDV